MFNIWIEYAWNILASFLNLPPGIVQGKKKGEKTKEEATSNGYPVMADKDKQLAVIDTGNREVESESTSETTLTEISKDLGHTKSLEKKAEYEEHNKESIVEEHKTQKSESSKQVTESHKTEISENRQVTQTSFSSSESFSMEETEEYEYEGDGTTLAIKQK